MEDLHVWSESAAFKTMGAAHVYDVLALVALLTVRAATGWLQRDLDGVDIPS